jgi:phosphate transport system substrate-binding protein
MRLTPLAKLFISGVVTAVVAFTGWQYYRNRSPRVEEPILPPTVAQTVAQPTRLRLAGSSTIGASLAPKLVRAWLVREGASEITASEGHVRGILRGAPIEIAIDSPGSAIAFSCLKDASCDIGMSSRRIHDDEIRALSTLGDLTQPGCEHILALDGIAVVVNRKSATSEMRLDELARIFGGTNRGWHVFTRDSRSGTFDAFTSAVLHDGHLRLDARVFEDSAALMEAIADDPEAIGFVSLSQVGVARAVALRDGDSPALLPTVFTIATEDYPLSRRLYLYTPSSASPLARSLVRFALSDEGQRVVEDAGFVSLAIKRQPADRHGYVKDGDRLSVNFRFRKGESQLDNRSLDDLDRLVGFLARERERRVTLLGFADNQGGDKMNLELSKKRGQSVAAQLDARGVHVERIIGLGSALPIAPNDTPEGRDRNRRVEVWIR